MQQHQIGLGDLGQREIGPGLPVEMGTGRFECPGGIGQQRGAFAVDVAEGILDPDRDAQIARACGTGRRQVELPAGGIGPARTGRDVEQQAEVFGRPGQRTGDRKIALMKIAGRRSEMAALRHDAIARLVAEDAAEMGRRADRAADIGAELGRGEAGRQRGRRAARRTAGTAIERVGVVGGAVDLVEALQIARKIGHVGLAENDGAGALQPFDGGGASCRHMILPDRIAAGGGETRDLVSVLDGEGQAVQRPLEFATRQRRVGRFRGLARAIEIPRDDRIDLRIVLFDPGDEVIGQLRRTDLAAADHPRKIAGRAEMKIGHR